MTAPTTETIAGQEGRITSGQTETLSLKRVLAIEQDMAYLHDLTSGLLN